MSEPDKTADKKTEPDTVYIIDGSSIIYRAFHAVPPSFTTSRGMPTNAVYGFTQTLRKIIADYRPAYIGIAFDVKGPSFRHELFEDYKAERPPMPDALSVQIPFIKRMARAMRVHCLEKESFEADDVIATLVKRLKGEGVKAAIITGDKDMFQLVDDRTVVLDCMSGKTYGTRDVEYKFGVPPEGLRDLLALAGDQSDNIPGVPGIGPKTAAKLIAEFGDIDGIYSNIDAISNEKLRDKLKANRDRAVLSRSLATLHYDVPFECALDDLKYEGPDEPKLRGLLDELEFKKLLKEMLPDTDATGNDSQFIAILNTVELQRLVDDISKCARASIAVALDGEGVRAGLSGVALSTGAEPVYYIPVRRDAQDGLAEDEILKGIKGVIEGAHIQKDTDDAKGLYIYFSQRNIMPDGIRVDTSIASYLLNPSRPDHSIEALAYEYLGIQTAEVKRRKDPAVAAGLTCKKVMYINLLSDLLYIKLDESGLKALYADLEFPLTRVLARMELAGIKADAARLKALSEEIERELTALEGRIYLLANGGFNINSPRQLSEVLFERLNLKPVKKTKTGLSTDEEVLTKLASSHEVPGLILAFRQLSKLKSTYTDALIGLIDPATGRIHTTFNQTVTATGRLSSSRPNLQNIPARGEWAARIREAFIPERGFTFLSADYSQIELRIAAHMSEDPVLIDAFSKDEDVHSRTASEIFGVMPALVTQEMRRRAKIINFGIIYGMGSYGLSAELGISAKEASDYIDSYFRHYSKVKEFIDRTIADALAHGYTVTLFGRRRFIPELNSPVESVRRLGERLAINTPVQGTAADMIKAAMLRIDSRLKSGGFKTRMILQIHDELLFEAPKEEFDRVKLVVKEEMESVISLKVPVRVNIKSGGDWNVAG